MHCVKTGARAYIHEMGILVACDIYSVGLETLVVKWNPLSQVECGPLEARNTKGATHFIMAGPGQKDDWYHQDVPVMITQRRFVEGVIYD